MTTIPGHDFSEASVIDKGVSGDRKFRVKATDGDVMLLRVSDITKYEQKKTMFEMMRKVAALGVPMSRPIEFGVCDDGKSVYQLLSWCEGDTADALLPRLSEDEQYHLGIKAGEILRTIHSISAPANLPSWHDRYICKNEGRVKAFTGCDVAIDGSHLLLSFYEQNRHLLYNRPQCFTHGDYHCDNMMVSDSMELSIIDWDLFDDNIYGDPWHEFTKILNADVIPHFSSGLLRGYFGSEPPDEFWDLLKFYFSAGALQLVSWGFYVEPNYLDECKKTAADVVKWYDGMNKIVPEWYLLR